MVWRDTKRLTAINDILAKTKGKRDDTFLCCLLTYWVIVQGTKHTREVRIIEIAIALTHDLLQDDGHLLLVNDVLGSRHISLRVLVIDRGIDCLDGTGEHTQHLVLIFQIWYHIGRIDTCEGLVVSILKERRGAHGDRRLNGIEEGEEVGYQRVWQLSVHEMLQDLIVRRITECYGIEVVLLHKLIKEVCTEHDGLGDGYLSILIAVQLRMALDDIIEEGQTTALATEGAFADAGEMAVGIKLQTVEHSYHTDVLHATILHDGVEDNLPMGIDILELVPGDVLEEGRYREDGTGTEPTAHVVARHMIEH